MFTSTTEHWTGALVALAAWAAVSSASAATLGLECRLDRRSPPNCPASGCDAADIRPYNESHWSVIEPVQLSIEEYAVTGADMGAPFRRPVITDRGEIHAEGGDLGPGRTTVSLIAFNPTTGAGGLSILVMPGGEFGGGGQSYTLSGACRLRPPAFGVSDKRPGRAS